ncbi:MAG TPA: DMT family transporter [Rhizomicrobium sp.]|jgi:drug/metabolite transporter (DMT)-like permease|nr:DMT family transporter [Rhizomicrobium sp.]
MNRPAAPLEGALWMVLAGAAFAGVNTLEQIATVQAGMPAPTAAFLQYLVAFVVVLPWAMRRGLAALSTRRPFLHGLRVVLAALGVQCWVAGLAHAVPIGTAIALVMTSPFFVTLGAGLFLRETVTPARWAAVSIGFVGGVVILNPFSNAWAAVDLLPVAAAAFWAGASLCQKRLLVDESPAASTAWLLLLLAPINLVLAVPSGLLPHSTFALEAIVAVGILTALAQGFLSLAYARADAAYVQPFDHVKLPLNIVAGWIVFGTLPPGRLWLGAALIVAASLFLLLHEHRAARAAV